MVYVLNIAWQWSTPLANVAYWCRWKKTVINIVNPANIPSTTPPATAIVKPSVKYTTQAYEFHCYYAALLPRRGPHIASHSVRLSVCPSVPLSSVTWRHLANYNDTHVLFGRGPHIVRPSRPHKFLLYFQNIFRSTVDESCVSLIRSEDKVGSQVFLPGLKHHRFALYPLSHNHNLFHPHYDY